MKSIKGNTWLKGLRIPKDENSVECDVHFCACYIHTIGENE